MLKHREGKGGKNNGVDNEETEMFLNKIYFIVISIAKDFSLLTVGSLKRREDIIWKKIFLTASKLFRELEYNYSISIFLSIRKEKIYKWLHWI